MHEYLIAGGLVVIAGAIYFGLKSIQVRVDPKFIVKITGENTKVDAYRPDVLQTAGASIEADHTTIMHSVFNAPQVKTHENVPEEKHD